MVCAFWTLAARPGQTASGPATRSVTVLYLGLLVFMGLLTAGALWGLTPDFYVPGQGATTLRYAILGLAILGFVAASVLFGLLFRGSRTRFHLHCCAGLAMIGIGLWTVLIGGAPGSVLNWLGRSGQYLGAVYLLLAILSAERGRGPWLLPLERALRETQDRYQTLVELSPDAIVVNVGGKYVFANMSAARLFGADSPGEVMGKDVIERVHPDDREQVAQRTAEVLGGAVTTPKEIRVLRLDGSPVEVEATAARIEFDCAPAAQVVFRDITERKRAEEALREGEERYRQLIESAHDWIWEIDEHGLYTFASLRVVELLGYKPEEVLGKTPFDLMPSDEAERIASLFALIAAERKAFRDLANTNQHKDGHLVFLETSGVPIFDASGNYRGYRGMDRDITEHKLADAALRESEDRYRQLFELESDAIVLVDNETGKIMEVNAAAVALYGYSREEWFSMNHTDVSAEPDKTRQAAMEYQTQIPVRWHKRRDGTVFPVEITGRHFDWKGRSVHIAAIRDITERVEAEEALRERDEQLRQSQKMEAVGQLAGGIAHDFNNLLAAILGYSDLLLAGQDLADPQTRRDVEEIRHAAERAAALTRQILAFSRRQALRPTVASLNDVLAGMEPLLRRTLGEDVELVSFRDSGLGQVEADVHQFEQVIMNLAINARDAMVPGGRLTVETANVELDEEYCRTHPEATPGGYVMLAVSDTGVGMNEGTRAHIFEPFFTTKAPGLGTGLGLATVYGIVRQSNGSISVYSEPGRGTTFKIYLPRVIAPVEQKSLATSGAASTRGDEAILVVEDEVSLRTLIARVLGNLGYRVLIAGTGAQALQVANEADCRLDLLLTDVVLPGGMQGTDLARDLLTSMPDLPVLYMSGYARDAIVHAGRLDQGVNFLEKPFTQDALATMVRAVLSGGREERHR
jgi:two-component system cell cycle sensor histidine kinase/response regulator CckA